VAEPRTHVPLDRHASGSQRLARYVQSLHGDQIVGLAMDEQDGRARLGLGQMLRPANRPE